MKRIAFLFVLLALSMSYGGQKVMETTLSNGVKFLIKETKGKGIVSVVVFFRGGQNSEKIKGETHLLFTLLLKGSEKYPSSYAVSLPFEKLGGYIYTSSGDDYSELGFSTKREGLEEALRVVKDIISTPLLREEDINREKHNTIVAIRSKRERGMSFAMEHLRKLTYKGTSYETTTLGTEESVSLITRDDLLRRLKDIMQGGNIVVSLVGDINQKEALALLEESFKDLPKGAIKIEEQDLPVSKDEVLRIKREGTQATILCAFGAPRKGTEDYFVFKVLSSALGEGMTSILFRELREKKGYAYATYAFYPTRLSAPRLFAYIGTSPDKKENALKDMVSLIKNPRITQKEIEMARNKIVGDFLLDHQTRLKQAWYMGFYEVMGMGWEMDLRYTENIKSVTLEKVKKAVSKYINHHHCVVVEP